jgi:hypothetical protein
LGLAVWKTGIDVRPLQRVAALRRFGLLHFLHILWCASPALGFDQDGQAQVLRNGMSASLSWIERVNAVDPIGLEGSKEKTHGRAPHWRGEAKKTSPTIQMTPCIFVHNSESPRRFTDDSVIDQIDLDLSNRVVKLFGAMLIEGAPFPGSILDPRSAIAFIRTPKPPVSSSSIN